MKKIPDKKMRVLLAAVAAFLLAAAAPGLVLQAAEEKRVVDVVVVNDVITPPIGEYIVKSIRQATESGSEAIVIQLDTPGGLDLSMRDIMKECLNASIPVVVYVSPQGARAASAGVLITISAHVAAMAPGTNIGAAHPVAMGLGKADETMMEKVENDAVAYGRGIAEQKGRNADWIEEAIRKSVSVTAEEALKLNVIDVIAKDVNDLLEKIDGREVKLLSGSRVLKTKGAELNRKEMGFREKVLITISNPNIAYILFLLGLAGLYFEFSSPGVVLPGIIGGISLILAFFAFQTLPVNYARHPPDRLCRDPLYRRDQGGQPRRPHHGGRRLAHPGLHHALRVARPGPPGLLERAGPDGGDRLAVLHCRHLDCRPGPDAQGPHRRGGHDRCGGGNRFGGIRARQGHHPGRILGRIQQGAHRERASRESGSSQWFKN